jgi:hypothetical protein
MLAPSLFSTRVEAEKEELTKGMVPACETEHMDMPQTFLTLPQQLQTLLSLQPPPIFSSVPSLSLSLSLSLSMQENKNPNLHNPFLLQNPQPFGELQFQGEGLRNYTKT